MEMTTIPITVPRGLIPYLEEKDQAQSFARKAMIIYPFIKNLTISHGRAAEILGVHKFDLIDFYCSMGLPYLDQSPEDLDEEISGFALLKEKRQHNCDTYK